MLYRFLRHSGFKTKDRSKEKSRARGHSSPYGRNRVERHIALKSARLCVYEAVGEYVPQDIWRRTIALSVMLAHCVQVEVRP